MLRPSQDREQSGENIMSSLYDLVNVFDKDNNWLGQFINEEVANEWIKKHKLKNCVVSKTRPATAERTLS